MKDDHVNEDFVMVVPHTAIMKEVLEDFQDNDMLKAISIESHHARIFLTQFLLSLFALL